MLRTLVLFLGGALNGLLAAGCTVLAIFGFLGMLTDTSAAENRAMGGQLALIAAFAILNLSIVKMAFVAHRLQSSAAGHGNDVALAPLWKDKI